MYENIVNELIERGLWARETVIKKNGVEKVAITIGKPDEQMRPNIYMDQFDLEDRTVKEIADELVEIYEASKKESDINIQAVTDPEYILKNCRVRLQRPSDQELVKRSFLDVEAYITVNLEVGADKCSYDLNPVLLENIGYDIWEAALENTRAEIVFENVVEILAKSGRFAGMFDDEMIEVVKDQNPYWVATNKEHFRGASAMMFPDIFKSFCEEHNLEAVYVIPSSIHEVLLMPYMEASPEEIRAMVADVNTNEVKPEEVLSDNAYIYRVATNEISIA